MEAPNENKKGGGMATFFWNKEDGTVMGRSCKAWGEIGIYYVGYYSCLAAFFVATIACFYQTIDSDKPRLLKDHSLLEGNPGLDFRPKPDTSKTKIVARTKGKNGAYVKDMDNFLKPYGVEKNGRADCTNMAKTRPEADMPCQVQIDYLRQSCSQRNDYGMKTGKPCVLIKINRVYGWEPDMWDNAPSSLSSDIKAVYTPSLIPLKCYAKNEKDVNDLGTIKYFPSQGFKVHYFPYENQDGYLSPFVMLQFINMKPGKTIQVECRIYAKNIKFDPEENQASVKFEIKLVK